MSLDVTLTVLRPEAVHDGNITHNLTKMASEAGLYQPLWRPEEIGISRAEQLIDPLTKGLALLKSDPERFKKLNPANGWGDYDCLVRFVESYLDACHSNLGAFVSVSR